MELEQASETIRRESLDSSGSPGVERDLPPEYCRYQDEGCELADSCLNCPFTGCIYDEPGGKQRWLKGRRAREMVKLFATKGKEVKELALMFGVSQRTVQRALKAALVDSTERGARKNE